MLGEVPVVDGVLHGYHFSEENRLPDGELWASAVSNAVFGFHAAYSPSSARLLTQAQMDASDDADMLGSMLFGESHTDVCVYHGLPMFGWFRDGGSPLSVGKEMRDRWPGRVLLYGPISAQQPGALESVDRLVEEDGVVGLKMYPVDLVDGRSTSTSMDDPEIAFPIFERAQQLGVKVIAVHKAVPMGPVPLAPYRPDDVDQAAHAFPDLTFEVVHGGFAFLDETTFQLARYPNVVVNLEGTSALLIRAPRRFLRIIGALMSVGASDRILWGTGAPVIHPKAFEEAMWQLRMPRDMVEEEGIPELTDDIKAGILGGNLLRMLGLRAEDLLAESSNDEFAGPRVHAEEWSGLPGRKLTAVSS